MGFNNITVDHVLTLGLFGDVDLLIKLALPAFLVAVFLIALGRPWPYTLLPALYAEDQLQGPSICLLGRTEGERCRSYSPCRLGWLVLEGAEVILRWSLSPWSLARAGLFSFLDG